MYVQPMKLLNSLPKVIFTFNSRCFANRFYCIRVSFSASPGHRVYGGYRRLLSSFTYIVSVLEGWNVF